jgi:hypothetical protein
LELLRIQVTADRRLAKRTPQALLPKPRFQLLAAVWPDLALAQQPALREQPVLARRMPAIHLPERQSQRGVEPPP